MIKLYFLKLNCLKLSLKVMDLEARLSEAEKEANTGSVVSKNRSPEDWMPRPPERLEQV